MTFQDSKTIQEKEGIRKISRLKEKSTWQKGSENESDYEKRQKI